MEIDIYRILESNGIILLFLVIGLGYLIGNLRIGGLPIGPTMGILLTALFFGHHGLVLPAAVGSFGFTLFIFAVGLEAGPRFFSAFREYGNKYVLLTLIVGAVGLALTMALSRLFSFEAGFDTGLMAGALTSTPTLAAAQDAVRSGLATTDAVLAEQMLENIGVGYALTYMVGTVLVILLIRYLPKALHLNLEAIALTYARENGILVSRDKAPTTAETLPIVRAYRVGDQGDGKTIDQRRVELGTEGVVLKIRRDGKILDADPRMELHKGDIISLVASLGTHRLAHESLGGVEVLDADLLSYHIATQELVALNKHVLGKTIKELEMAARFGCFATGLVRAGVHLPITEEVALNKGDRILVVGEESRLRELSSLIGYVEQEVEETDLVTFSLGIVLGSFIGLISFSLAGMAIGLGSAGGYC